MKLSKILGNLVAVVVALLFAVFFALQYEPARAVDHFAADILDRRYTGVSVVNGAPNEAEVQVALRDGRVVWLPGLRYYLDEGATQACVVTLSGRVTGFKRFKTTHQATCNL